MVCGACCAVGTFGRVLECWDRKLKDYVAVKIVRNVDKYRHAAMIEVGVWCWPSLLWCGLLHDPLGLISEQACSSTLALAGLCW
jgi:hypothetical protein